MALTYGFYNSIDGDRVYDAIQFGQIFDGIIKDGIYATYKKGMVVIASENAGQVIIQPGRAWFNHTWSYNDANLIMEAPAPEVLLERIDALVLEINEEISSRENSYKWVTGTPSSNPVRPTLTNTATIHQYPLCYIHRYPETTMIYERDITSTVGTSECPFATGVLEGIDLDAWINQWDNEFHHWENTTKASYDVWSASAKTQMENDIQDVEDWIVTIKDIIDSETATHLQNEIDELREEISTGSVIIVTTNETTLYNRNVTLTDNDGNTVTSKFNNTGVAEFKSVPYVGALKLSSTDGTAIAKKTLNVPYFGRYTTGLSFWQAIVNITPESDLADDTVTVTNSEGSTIGTILLDEYGAGTWEADEPDTYTFMIIKGGKVMSVTLNVSQETTYTIDFYTTVNVTLYSAANDVVTYVDMRGSHVAVTNGDGVATDVPIAVKDTGTNVTFSSIVAKDPTDLTLYYSKTIFVEPSTTSVYVMPSSDKVLYWYGYKSSNFTLTARVDISSQYAPTPATYTTNYVQMTAYSNQRCCIGSTDTVTGVTTAAYTILSDVSNNSTGYQDFEVASNYNPRSGKYISMGYTAPLRVLTCATNGSPSTGWIRLHESVGTSQTATAKVYAIWWD